MGGGYGGGGWVRNDFQEIVSCGENWFTWCMSTAADHSVEIYAPYGGDVRVWSAGDVTFTTVNSLSTTKNNRILLSNANYTDYTVTKTGGGASGTWGISITGNADTVDNYHGEDLLTEVDSFKRRLQVRTGSGNCANNTDTYIAFSSPFTTYCAAVVPISTSGFNEPNALSIVSNNKNGVTVKQRNAMGVSMNVIVVAFGY